jgi:hypothetical protein
MYEERKRKRLKHSCIDNTKHFNIMNDKKKKKKLIDFIILIEQQLVECLSRK